MVSERHGRAVSSSIEEDSVAALRRASLDLDETAMRLEVSDRYSEADALREAAQHLRMKARGLKQPAAGGVTATSAESQEAFKFSVGITR